MNQDLLLRLIIEAVDHATADIDGVHEHVRKLKEELLSNEFVRTAEGIDALAPKIEALTAPAARANEKLLALNAALVAVSSLIAGSAYKASVDYEAALSDLAKVLEGGRAEAEQHGTALSKLALQYGQNGQALVGSLANFVQAGYQVADATNLVEQSIRLMIAGDLDAEKSSQLLIATLKGFDAPASDAARLIDVLNQVSNQYATDVGQLATGMAAISPIAHAMGFSFEETAGLLTPIIEVFGSGNEAAEGLKTTLLKLTDDSKPVRDALAALGVSQTEANGALRSGKAIFEEVAMTLGGLSEAQRTYYTQQLVGIDQAARASALFGNYSEALAVTQTALTAAGSAQREVDERLKTSDVQIKQTEESFRQFAVTLGTQFRTEVTGVVDASGQLVEALNRTFQSGNLEPFFAALRPQVQAVETLITAVANHLEGAFEGLDWSPLVAGLGAVSGELGEALRTLTSGYDLATVEGLRGVLQAVVNTLGNLTQWLAGSVDGLGPFLARLNGLFEILTQSYPALSNLVGEITGLSASVNYSLPVVQKLGEYVFGTVDKVVNLTVEIGLLVVALRALNAAGLPIGPMLSGVVSAAGSLLGMFLRLSPTMAGIISAMAGFPGATAGFVAAAGGAGYALGTLIDKGVEWATGGTALSTALSYLIEDVVDFGKSVIGAAEAEESSEQTVQAARARRLAQQQQLREQAAAEAAERENHNRGLLAEADYQARIAEVVGQVMAGRTAATAADQVAADQLDLLRQRYTEMSGAQTVNMQSLEDLTQEVKAYGDAEDKASAAKLDRINQEQALAAATGDTVKAVELAGEAAAEEVAQSARVVAQRQLEADIAEKIATEKERLAAAADGLNAKLNEEAAASRTAADGAREAAAAAGEQYAAWVRLPEVLGQVRREHQLTTAEIANFRGAAATAIATAHEQEQAYRDGRISLGELAAAQATAKGALETYTQALKTHIEQINTKAQAEQRAAGLTQQAIQTQIAEKQAALASAKARGDETEAVRLGIQIKQLEAQQAAATAAAKQREAAIARELAAALEEQAKADGTLTAAEQESIQAAKDSATAKQLEANASKANAASKQTEADAAKQEAATKKTSKEATDEAKTSQDALNQSQNDSVQILTAGEKALTAYTNAVNNLGNMDLGLKIANDSLRQKDSLESLKASLDAAANSGQGLGDAMRSAGLSSDLSGVSIEDLRRRFNLLDDADLSSLLSSVNSVRSAVQSLRDSTASTLSTLQDELDSLTGNEQAKTEREYQTKKAELDAAYQEAVNARDAQSQNSALEAIRLLEEIHQRKMAAFDEEAKAKQKAEETPSRPSDQPRTTAPVRTDQSQSTPVPAAPSDTIRLELVPIGSSRIIPATVDRQFEDDLRGLSRAKKSAI